MSTIEYRDSGILPCHIPKMKRAALEDLAVAQMATIVDLEAKVSEARGFAEHACRKHNELLEQKRRVTCVYCGHQYPDGTPESQAAALTAHIEACHMHPLGKALADIDKLATLLRTALADLTGVRAGRLTPDQLQIFLAECKSALDAHAERKKNS